MSRTPREYRRSLCATRRNRRGLVTGLVLCAMIVLIGLLGLAWNVQRLAHVREQLRAACEAAALAGTAELMDPNVLINSSNTSAVVMAARLEAQQFAATNVSFGQQVLLGLNENNSPYGDIVVGYVPLPTLVGCPLEIWQGSGPVNSVSVKASNSAHRGNPILMYCGEFFGIPFAKAAQTARASLDQRIYGFRPISGINLPLVPLAAQSNTWFTQASAPAVAEVNDNYIVDYQNEAVTNGSDGIPEIELSTPLSSAASSASTPTLVGLIVCPSADPGDSGRQAQLVSGLAPLHLLDLGGEFSLGLSGQLILPTTSGFDETWLQAFLTIQGQKRIWPLGTDASGNPPGYDLSNFGCAVVVNARIDTSGKVPQLVVTLQPALMTTSAALVCDDLNDNPWIAKLMLTE